MQENLDYILFLVVTAAVFGAITFILPRHRKGAHFPPAALLIAAVIAGASWWSIRDAGDEAQERIENAVQALAPTYAAELEFLGHEKVTLQTAPNDATYLTIVDRIRHWAQLSTFAHDIYTIRRTPEGKDVFIVDPETDYDGDGKFDGENEERTAIGEPVTEVDDGLDRALSGEANFSREVVHDKWGDWVGAWAPIRGKDGKVEAAVGVDFKADQWMAAVSTARQHAIVRVAMLLALLAAGAGSYALLRADTLVRREAEERSRQTEQRMNLTLDRMPLAYVELTPDAQCVTWNPRAAKIFGLSSDASIGRSALDFVPANSREHVQKMWAQLIAQTGGNHSIHENITQDGREIVCEWFNTVVTDNDGKVSRIICLGQDITERVNLEKHLQHSQRMNAVGQLAAGVAHDFNNILTIITGHAGLVLDHPDLPDETREDLERIEEAALRASGLTRQLLTFSRKQAMFPRPVQLGSVVKNTVSMLKRVLGDDVVVTSNIGTSLPAIEADPTMLDQVVTNLVLNARDAMPRGGAIQVRVEKATVDETFLREHPDATLGDSVCLVVADNGKGIPTDVLGRIFEPFFTTKETGKGTGLGLSVVHGIVKQHHGCITVDSKVDHGTTIRIYFPSTTKPITREDAGGASSPNTVPPEKRRTILLAEDEGIVRDLARIILERAGYNVLHAEDGVQALKIWEKNRNSVDLLLTDMMMPNGVTGRDLSQKLLAEVPELPVVYASGYSLELTAPDFRETEKQIFLPKPYLADQLVAAVKRCLGEATHGKN